MTVADGADDVRVAAWQMTSGDDWLINRQSMVRGLAAAAAAGVQLVVLPENAAVFGAAAALALARRHDEILAWLAAQARDHELYVLAGTLPAPDRPDGTAVPGGRVRSASYLLSPSGAVLGRYDKRHLFDAQIDDVRGSYQESLCFEPGDDCQPLPTPWGGLGVLTCYDLRFPEQARALVAAGAALLVVPAAFTARTGEAHWQVLLRARAIENQCLVIGAGQVGWHDASRQTWGHSQIIDAWGQVLAERVEPTPGLVLADWSRQQQAALRAAMPCLAHRRDACSAGQRG